MVCGRHAQTRSRYFTFSRLCELRGACKWLKSLLPPFGRTPGTRYVRDTNTQPRLFQRKVVNQGFVGISGFGVVWRPFEGVWVGAVSIYLGFGCALKVYATKAHLTSNQSAYPVSPGLPAAVTRLSNVSAPAGKIYTKDCHRDNRETGQQSSL